MSSKQYTEEFKIEAVKQVKERGYSVAEVANRLGTTSHSMYSWLKRYGQQSSHQANRVDDQAEIARLKSELRADKYFGWNSRCQWRSVPGRS